MVPEKNNCIILGTKMSASSVTLFKSGGINPQKNHYTYETEVCKFYCHNFFGCCVCCVPSVVSVPNPRSNNCFVLLLSRVPICVCGCPHTTDHDY